MLVGFPTSPIIVTVLEAVLVAHEPAAGSTVKLNPDMQSAAVTYDMSKPSGNVNT